MRGEQVLKGGQASLVRWITIVCTVKIFIRQTLRSTKQLDFALESLSDFLQMFTSSVSDSSGAEVSTSCQYFQFNHPLIYGLISNAMIKENSES